LALHFAASARAGLALIWKIVLVVEFLGRSNGIGFQIYLYFQLFEVIIRDGTIAHDGMEIEI
jgi:NitT/TauT family transport system permease protein